MIFGEKSCNQKDNFFGRSCKENISLRTGLEQEPLFILPICALPVFVHLPFSFHLTQCGSITTISSYIAQQQNNLQGTTYLFIFGLLHQNISATKKENYLVHLSILRTLNIFWQSRCCRNILLNFYIIAFCLNHNIFQAQCLNISAWQDQQRCSQEKCIQKCN